MTVADPTMQRLEDQIEWYDHKSNMAEFVYKTLKALTICSAALIPLFASISVRAWIDGGLGVLVVVLEGIQQLGQYGKNWISYRSTCEALRHEKFLYLANAGPYPTASDAHRLLAERVEAMVSQENIKWVSSLEDSVKRGAQPSAQE